MHCFICGKSDHNKKGHDKYMAAEVEAQLDEEEEIEDPSILQDIMPARLNPRLDPMNVRTSMVYMMGHEDRAYVSQVTPPGPLPEQAAFVLDAIDSIPQRTRTTTTTNRGRVRARRKSRTISEQTHLDEPGSSAQAGR
ncbi:uncharacterized protein [Triticum aestivum]|uniref:uncharacterized protein n=1 Tax=Triticum aestivum TaxID=4565 RepID=UPI001D00469D|nr:uncharacterized protein LOC123063443 [Triticum aestivum]